MGFSKRAAVFALAVCLAGCGTTRMTDTQRTATEQLLVSNAVDQAVTQFDFRNLAGKPVFFDAQYLDGVVDRGYLVSSIRQHLLASGCLLQEERVKADYVVEARSGGVGTNRSSLLVGVPQMNVPTFAPGQPSFIPEIPLAKKTDQEGIAKVAVFAYNRKTGQPAWQSGVVQCASNAKDTWVLGAGPFQQGTIRKGTEFAGGPLPIPAFGGNDDGTETLVATKVRVTDPAVWPDTMASGPTLQATRGPIMDPRKPEESGSILPTGSESKIDRGVPWSLMSRPESVESETPPTLPPFTPPTMPSAPSPPTNVLKPPAPTPAPANLGGQAETEPNKVDASGISQATPTNSGTSMPGGSSGNGSPDGMMGPPEPIDALSWYGAISRRVLK